MLADDERRRTVQEAWAHFEECREAVSKKAAAKVIHGGAYEASSFEYTDPGVYCEPNREILSEKQATPTPPP